MAVDWTQVLVAGIAGAPAIWAAWTASRASRNAKEASRKVDDASKKVDDVGKQVGRHNYEVKDRMSTEAVKADAIQRGVETLVAAKSNKPSEQSVWNYVRQAKASQNEAQLAAAQALHALEQVQMMLGQTPTIKVPAAPLGPLPPPVPPIGDE